MTGVYQVIAKFSEHMNSDILAYNLAHKFRVIVPKQTSLPLSSVLAETFIAGIKKVAKACLPNTPQKKAAVTFYDQLTEARARLKQRNGILLMEKVKGTSFQKWIKASRPKIDCAKVGRESLIMLGRMLVYDAAIMNTDRFKLGMEGNRAKFRELDGDRRSGVSPFIAAKNTDANIRGS